MAFTDMVSAEEGSSKSADVIKNWVNCAIPPLTVPEIPWVSCPYACGNSVPCMMCCQNGNGLQSLWPTER